MTGSADDTVLSEQAPHPVRPALFLPTIFGGA